MSPGFGFVQELGGEQRPPYDQLTFALALLGSSLKLKVVLSKLFLVGLRASAFRPRSSLARLRTRWFPRPSRARQPGALRVARVSEEVSVTKLN